MSQVTHWRFEERPRVWKLEIRNVERQWKERLSGIGLKERVRDVPDARREPLQAVKHRASSSAATPASSPKRSNARGGVRARTGGRN